MKKSSLIALFLLVATTYVTYSQGLKSFKLPNGLQVYVWEDANATDVFGMVAVKAGSVNDPIEYTGLAHYLEHVMFKGTDRIGAIDWVKEKPIYEQIIAKYDERANATSPEQIQTIDDEINLLTSQQSTLTKNNEFQNLVESMGGTGLNAGTSYDYTVYHNSFPKVQLEKWLDLYSVRFMNPVFRTFQAELETVYEEYNMYKDNPQTRLQEYIFQQIFNGTSYARSIIGSGYHLKNPRLSKLIEFYEKHYVPENMALILVGDLKTEDITKSINRRFSRLPQKPFTQETMPKLSPIIGRSQKSGKVGIYPMVVLAFNSVPTNHPDFLVLEVVNEMLSNISQTGLLDKLGLDGDLMFAGASSVSFSQGGRIMVQGVPTYDYNQGRFESHRYVEKLLVDHLNKLVDGDVDSSLLESVKGSLTRDYLRLLEENSSKGELLAQMFTNDMGVDYVLNYSELVGAITMADVNRVAQKYLTKDFIALHLSEEGSVKPEKLSKPELQHDIEFPFEGETVYSQWFKQLPVANIDLAEIGFEDVQIESINEKSQLFYYPNKENDVFTMTIRYQIGEREMPKLDYATSLMNSAGVLGTYEPNEFRAALSQLNATVRYVSDDNYVTVFVEGEEAYLQEVCNLITRQILMPKLVDKQLDQLKGSIYQQRRIEKEHLDTQEDALLDYMRYGEASSYIDRMKWVDVMKLGISELTGVFQRATDYAAQVHYSGRLSFEETHAILSANLPLKAQELAGQSPKDDPYTSITETKVYFVSNSKANQSRILFFRPLEVFDVALDAQRIGFNRYFGEGFTGLVTQEIREKRSMAYASDAIITTPYLNGSPMAFRGFVGTQGDKTHEAVDVFMGLVNEMPLNEQRMDGIKGYLRQALVTSQPSFRYISQVFEMDKLKGYVVPRTQALLPYVNALTFKNLIEFYERNIKEKPLYIGIVGNPSEINLKALEKYGKVEKINVNKLFLD